MRDKVSEPLDRAYAGRVLPKRREFALHYNRSHISQEFAEGALR